MEYWHGIVSLGFRLLYQELAWCYDAVAWLVSFGQWRSWERTALPRLAGEKILELGHGPGHLVIDLIEHGYSPVGLDVSPQMGQLAKRRLRRVGQGVTIVRGRAERLPFPDRAFDSVISTFPTKFIVESDTLSEVSRVLSSDGRLVVVLCAQQTSGDPISRTIEWLFRVTGQRRTTPGTRDNWEAPFLRAGFTTRLERVQMKHSSVLLLTAERVTPGDRQ
jgi:ubiquinone/menaquinone biosynthesis C-methylase UbiE